MEINKRLNQVGIIIVDYGSDPLLERTLNSIPITTQSLKIKVILIENCPNRKKISYPKNLDVQSYQFQRNLGFGGAVNLARKKLDTPYLFLLNPDVELLPETISILYEFMESHDEVGITVPKLVDSHGNIQFSSRKFYDLSSILLRRTFLGKLFPNHPDLRNHLMMDWDHNSIQEIDWALGACMLIREKAVKKEVFDPRFFLYFEDVDLCLRVYKAGWKVVYHPRAIGVHEYCQKSRKSFFSKPNYEHFKSWMKFMAKYKSISGKNLGDCKTSDTNL